MTTHINTYTLQDIYTSSMTHISKKYDSDKTERN